MAQKEPIDNILHAAASGIKNAYNKTMDEENKNLLLKDLCARLPYGVKVWYKYATWISKKFATSIRLADEKIALSSKFNKEGDWFSVEEAGEILIKPYLRPMSSMTESERKEFDSLSKFDEDVWMGNHKVGFPKNVRIMSKCVNWLNKNMFDYRGLIPKGLALEAPEGMYEHETKLEFNESDPRIGIGCKIRSKTNPDVILRIVSDDCHGDKFECSNGSVLSLKQIKKHYDLYIEENKGTIIIN